MFSNIKIILVQASHPGNIGAVMRAMETMGLDELLLVAPKQYNHPDVTSMASNATKVVEKVTVVETLTDALEGSEIVIGTSARFRSISLPKLSARECGTLCLKNKHKNIAILFGSERTGLTNEQLMCCSKQVYIPTSDHYSVLNLAMAVQVICYEIKMASLQEQLNSSINQTVSLAEYQEIHSFYLHLEKVLNKMVFFHSNEPKKLMLKLRRLFNRVNLEKSEINILRGILNYIDKYEH